MSFNFTGNNLNGMDKKLQRFLEILPGGVSWLILIIMTLLAFIKPLAAAVIIIAFYLYWFFRLLYLTIFLLANDGTVNLIVVARI